MLKAFIRKQWYEYKENPEQDFRVFLEWFRLLETNGEHGRYIALSHSWGPSGVKFTTKASNIGDRMQAIWIKDMPRTFRDVVMLARFLFVQYIWIDSLSIIQGDQHDWETQAPKMSEVYSHAYLTVSVSDATSSAD
jgi:hypothetical protein